MVTFNDKTRRIDLIAVMFIIMAGMVMLYNLHKVPEFRRLFVGEPFLCRIFPSFCLS